MVAAEASGRMASRGMTVGIVVSGLLVLLALLFYLRTRDPVILLTVLVYTGIGWGVALAFRGQRK